MQAAFHIQNFLHIIIQCYTFLYVVRINSKTAVEESTYNFNPVTTNFLVK